MNIKRYTFIAVLCFTYLIVLEIGVFAANLSGTIRYENRIYDSVNGFTGTNYLPVRLAKVVAVVDGTSYWGDTDTSGNYLILLPGGIHDVFVIVYAHHDATYNVIVKDNLTNKATYTVITSTQQYNLDNPQIIDIDITIASGVAPAFNIFDCGIWAYQFMESLQNPMPSPLPEMRFYWESGQGTSTAYSPALNCIFIRSEASDPDDFDDDPIMHEIGHFIAGNFSKDDSSGGNHTVTGQYDARLTWSEGWATYWSCRTKAFAGLALYPEPWAYVDTDATGTPAISINVEIPSFSALAIMATNELAVSSVLWDIADDTPAETADPTLAMGDDEIWVILYNDLPLATEVTLEDFFKGWRTRYPSSLVAVQDLFATRTIKYFVDGNLNDSYSTATTMADSVADNTIYIEGDIDWFLFTVGANETVRVETYSLGDGCDTYMYLYSQNGTTLLAENNNSATGVNSSITNTFITAGTYYAMVKSFDGAGRITEFGFYNIRVIRGIILPSSSSGGGGGEGCFIATAAYGSYNEPEVVALRNFRDKYLLSNSVGSTFVGCYYKISPTVANYIRTAEEIKYPVRFMLTPAVKCVRHPIIIFTLSTLLLMLLSIYTIRKRILS